MVNGTLSRILYVGAFACIGLLIVCMTILSTAGAAIPTELSGALMALIAFVAGAHIKPPVSLAATASVASDSPVTIVTTTSGKVTTHPDDADAS